MRISALITLFLFSLTLLAEPADRPPNVIIILADDMGYGDIGANGNIVIRTPHIDQLAQDGINFSQFYASANVCTPSRAGLLTGRFAIRSGLGWDVVAADSDGGLPPAAVTIAEVLGAQGYATAMVGKWHLGNQPPLWPTNQGFDTFYGVQYSNDMPGFALYQGQSKIEQPVNQRTLTRRYTQQATAFIRANRDRPFFLYLAHTFPHIPLFASAAASGKSRAGLYGDVIEELDWSTGQIMALLSQLGLRRDTLVVFTSDNGAWWEGSNGSSRGAKGQTWDGGYRVPMVAAWPAQIAPDSHTDALAMNIDLLPTIAAATGAALDPAVALDGRSILPLLRNPQAPSPHRYLLFFADEEIVAIRSGRWKLVTHAYYRNVLGALENFDHLPGFDAEYWLLFDMHQPHSERYSAAREHPDIVARLHGELTAARSRFSALRTHAPRPIFPPPG